MSTQIIEMFKESNSRMKQIMKGGFNFEQMQTAQREFEAQIKLVNSVISAFAVVSKNKRAMLGLERMNLLDDSTAIDLGLGDHETDKVKCPVQNKLICRHECLDFSGEAKHYEDCQGCEIGIDTKRKLIPLPSDIEEAA